MEVDYKGFCKALGAHIKELRHQRGWSNRDMLMVHGVNDSQWRKYERGGGLTVESLLRVAALFDLSIAQLLDGLSDFPAKSVPGVQGKPSAVSAKASARKSGMVPKKKAATGSKAK